MSNIHLQIEEILSNEEKWFPLFGHFIYLATVFIYCGPRANSEIRHNDGTSKIAANNNSLIIRTLSVRVKACGKVF